jgi:hypothetical protein
MTPAEQRALLRVLERRAQQLGPQVKLSGE